VSFSAVLRLPTTEMKKAGVKYREKGTIFSGTWGNPGTAEAHSLF